MIAIVAGVREELAGLSRRLAEARDVSLPEGRGRRGTLAGRPVVLDGAGREVAHAETTFTASAGEDVALEQRLAVPAPALWSPEAPQLYALRSEVLDGTRAVDVTDGVGSSRRGVSGSASLRWVAPPSSPPLLRSTS